MQKCIDLWFNIFISIDNDLGKFELFLNVMSGFLGGVKIRD